MKTIKNSPAIITVLAGILTWVNLLGQVDQEGLFGDTKRTLTPMTKGGQTQVLTGDGKTATLLKTAQAIWANHDRIKTQLGAIPKSALLGKPVSKDEFFQDADVFVAVRRTKVVLKNPELLRQSNPELAKHLGLNTPKANSSQSKEMKVSELDARARQGFDQFLRNEIPRLPADNPLRIAAALGQDSLLRAIVRGEGEIEIVDALAVPRKAGSMLLRGLSQNRGFDLKAKPMRLFLGAKPALPESKNRRSSATPREARDPSGEIVFTTNMLAGFTRGNEWRWQRKWHYPSGFFRVDLGGRYALGLRVPIKVQGKFSSTRRVDAGLSDQGFPARLELTPRWGFLLIKFMGARSLCSMWVCSSVINSELYGQMFLYEEADGKRSI